MPPRKRKAAARKRPPCKRNTPIDDFVRPDSEGVESESEGAPGMRDQPRGRYEPREADDDEYASSHSVNSADGESDATDGDADAERNEPVVAAPATTEEAVDRVRNFVTGGGMADYMNAMHNMLNRVREFGTELNATTRIRSSILMIVAARNTWRVQRRNGANVSAVCMLCAATHSCAYDVICGGEEARHVGYAGIQCATRFEALCAVTRVIADTTACYRAPFADNTAVLTALVERERQADALILAADRAVHPARRKRR